MSVWLVVFITVIYVAVAVSLAFDQRIGLALAYAGWAIGNVGLLLELL